MTAVGDTTWPPESAPSALLRLDDFRLLLAIQVFVGLRGPTLWFAQAWYVNTAAPESQRLLWLGLLASVNGAAFLGWSLFGGAIADRYPRRVTLIASHAAGAVLVSITTGLFFLPGVEEGGPWLPVVLLLFSTMGLMNAQDLPARTALIADIVPDRHLTTAVTINWLVLAVMMIAGNGLGGALVEWLGFGTTYAVGVVGHVAVAILASQLRVRVAPGDSSARGRSLLRNVRDGVAYVRRDRAVRWAVLLMWISVLCGTSVLWTLGAAWMNEVLGVGPAGWSLLTALWSIGMVVSSAWLMSQGDYRGMGPKFVAAALLYAAAVLTYSLSRSIAVTACALFFAGFAFQGQQTVGTALLQREVPRALLGRITALLFLSQGLAQTSGLAFGLLGQALGLPLLFAATGAMMLASAAAIALVQRPLRALG
ncbi:MAG: MFS transporter [Chloroflexi bacterium]|nr:MFS transporter [Chloroflexota bacterium]